MIPAMYIVLIASFYFRWGPNPDNIEIPMSVINTFRDNCNYDGSFFSLIGVFSGLFWNKFRPYKSAKLTF